MKENKYTTPMVAKAPEHVPQMKVRTNVRGGGSVESCMQNRTYWQNEYYKWYEQAKYKSV